MAPLCCGFPLAILERFFQGSGSFRWGGRPPLGEIAVPGQRMQARDPGFLESFAARGRSTFPT